MPKFYGPVGYVEDKVTGLDLHTNVPTERMYRGDIEEYGRRLDKGEGVNENVTIENTISIIADAYAYEHFSCIRYVEWMGVAWAVKTAKVKRPRIILSLGGVYNGETATEP